MPIKVTCPKCQGVLHAPDDAGGKRGKCPTCGTVLAIPAVGEAASNTDLPFAADPPRPSRPTGGTASAPSLGSSAIDADARRSSFGSIADAPADAPRASTTKLPPSFGPGEPPARKGDPFARKAPKPADPAPATDSEARGYRALRRGLGTAGFGYTLVLLGVVGHLVVPLLPQFGVALPDKTPGYLQQPELSTRMEIHAAAALIPALLGVLLILLGRSSTGSAPRASGARGTFKLTTLFTLLAVAGLVAYAVPTVLAALAGLPPTDLLGVDEKNEYSGHAQRGGIAVAAVFAPLAELLFWFGVARLGAGLGDARLTGRVTRYAFYAVSIVAVIGLAAFGRYFYDKDVLRLIAEHVEPQLKKLGDYRKYLPEAEILVVALSAWLLKTRTLGAARRAVRAWLDRHA